MLTVDILVDINRYHNKITKRHTSLIHNISYWYSIKLSRRKKNMYLIVNRYKKYLNRKKIYNTFYCIKHKITFYPIVYDWRSNNVKKLIDFSFLSGNSNIIKYMNIYFNIELYIQEKYFNEYINCIETHWNFDIFNMLNKFKSVDNILLDNLLLKASTCGEINFIKLTHNNFTLNTNFLIKIYSTACIHNHLNIVKYIHTLIKIPQNKLKIIIRDICERGHTDALIFLMKNYSLCVEDFNYSNTLQLLCQKHYNIIFNYICEMYNFSKKDMNLCNAICHICKNNSIVLIKLLHTKFGYSKMYFVDQLHNVCQYGNIQIIMYFHKNLGFTINDFQVKYNIALKQACKYNHYEIVKYLCDEIRINLKEIKHDGAFMYDLNTRKFQPKILSFMFKKLKISDY